MEMHHHHHHRLAFLQQYLPVSDSSAAVTEFDAIFAGVSLQSLLLGEPVLVTPPPPPFPPTTTFSPPLHLDDNRVAQHHQTLHPPTFFFQADATTASREKQRCQPVRRSSPQYCSSSTRNHVAAPPRRQRQKVSEKLKDLRRIVPCDKKADIATMLEQAYRYVRFLKAQVLALLTMNFQNLDPRHEGRRAFCFGDGTSEIERRMIEAVGRLSRQEVVEAVVNSGTAQKVMYEEGLCLVSEEQVRVLGWAAFQKQQQQQQQLSGLIGADQGNNNNNNHSCYSYSYSYSN